MRRLPPPADSAARPGGFLPELSSGGPANFLTPAVVAGRADGQIVHLDGLNLSRARRFANPAHALPTEDTRAAVLRAAARHLEAGLACAAGGDCLDERRLADFAVCALERAAGL